MPIDESFMRASYLDLKLALGTIESGALGNARREITAMDVQKVLDARDEKDYIELAYRYAFYDANDEPELKFDMEKSDRENAEIVFRDAARNALGYVYLHQLMIKALQLKEVCDKERVTMDDLRAVGIEKCDASTSDYFYSALFEAMELEAAERFGGNTEAVFRENGDLRRRVTCPVFHCYEHISRMDTPYSRRLQHGIVQTIATHPAMLDYEEKEGGFIFDLINDHFAENATGYQQVAQKALDTLFRINLVDIQTITVRGEIRADCLSVYAALWYELSRSLNGSRVVLCQACGRPIVVYGERGQKRKYCDQNCRKWAQRHPGELRGRGSW